MTTTTTVIVIIVVIAIVLVAIAALMAARRRKQEQQRQQAAEVRAAATEHTETIKSSHEDLSVAESRADVARAEAERADQEAAEARRKLEMDQAVQEDRLREADRIDPDVDYRADDYEPGSGRHRTS
jgi:FtsZ-interacting cell division protein ZipA